MSSNHDHPGHDHRPTHEHGHAHEEPASVPPPETEMAAIEDSSTRALAEALRSSFVIVKVLMVFLVLVFLFSGVFIVKPHEQAVIFRLGKPVGTPETMVRGPGLHWAFPYPIDEPQRISIGQLQSVRSTAGWHSQAQGFTSLNPATEGYTLTADGNIIHVNATLGYRVNDVVQYAFHFSNASNIVQNALNSALFYASAHFTVDQAVRLNTRAFQERILARVSELLREHELGIVVETLNVETVVPQQVRDKFTEVSAAEQERSTAVLAAQKERSGLLSRAESDASRMVNEAETDRLRLVSSLKAQASYLEGRLPEYEKDPGFFRQRLIASAMRRVLEQPNVEKWVLPASQPGDADQLRLHLNRGLPRRQPAQAGEAQP